jgi:thymidylate synthase (FAD)
MIDEGIAPEMARMVLPQSMMTEWIWSGSLMAWARLCKLRLDPHAQAETAIVARRFDEEIKQLFPVSWEALMKEES